MYLKGVILAVVCGFSINHALARDEALCDRECLYKRAERLIGPEMEAAMRGAAPQRRYWPGPRPLLDPLAEIHWNADSQGFWYVRQAPSNTQIIEVNAAERRRHITFDFENLSKTKWARSTGFDPAAIDPQSVEYALKDSRPVIRFDFGGEKITYSDGGLSSSPKRSGMSVFSSDGAHEIFARDHNLFVRKADGSERQLSFDGEQWRSFNGEQARSNPVEGRAGAAPKLQWMGDGPWLAIQRSDHRRVRTNLLVDGIHERYPTVREQRMAAPGDENIPLPELWLFNADSGEKIEIPLGDGWAYFGNIDVNGGGVFPAADGAVLYFTRISRDLKKIGMFVYDLQSGTEKQLFVERGKPIFGVRYADLFLLEDKSFLWKSDRDGYHHYYHYRADGKFLGQVTEGIHSVDRILSVSDAGDVLYLAFGKDVESPYQPHIYKTSLNGGSQQRISEDGAHAVEVSPDGRFIVDTVSDVDVPPKMVLRDGVGEALMVLEEVEAARFAALGWRAPEAFSVLAADGETPLYGVMWTPPEMEAGRKYPLVMQAYPGPAYEVAPVGFTPDHINAAFSELGFVVVASGHRGGSPIRGKAYQHYARGRDLRTYPIEDNAKIVQTLAERFDFIDIERVGMIGRSGGGFMTVAAMLARPDLYRAGVAVAGNYDNNIYEMNSSELHFGRPDEKGYPALQDMACQLRGDLMIAHGDLDDDVTFHNYLRLSRALMECGKSFRGVVLPGEAHSRYSPRIATYLRRSSWDFLREHLAGEKYDGVNIFDAQEGQP